MKETWKDISGHRGYQISSRARVRSLPRILETSNSLRLYKGRLIKQSVQHLTGYKVFCVSHKGVKKVLRTHREYMKAFKGESWLHVNHKNGDRTDNRSKNLEYVTQLRNNNHAVRRRKNKYGVYWNKKNEKWISTIHIKDSVKYLGSFTNKQKAHQKFYDTYLQYHNIAPW